MTERKELDLKLKAEKKGCEGGTIVSYAEEGVD